MKNLVLAELQKVLPKSIKVAYSELSSAYFHANVEKSEYDSNATGEAILSLSRAGLEPLKFKIPIMVVGGHQGEPRRTVCGYHDYPDKYLPKGGYCSLTLSRLLSAIHSLPKDASVKLVMYLDGQTNDNLTQNQLHADECQLHATFTRHGREVVRCFMLDVNIVPHNSARFGSPKGMDCYGEF